MNNSNKLITILGPTAVGKTRFAAQLANNFHGEIISADSRQVYIGMDLGTGKDYDDYIVDGQKINYHLIDVVKPHCEFNLYLFTQYFQNIYSEIISDGNLPFLVGGSGMYISSVIQKYNLNKVDLNSERAKELFDKEVFELKKILLDLNKNLHNTTDLIEKERLVRAIIIAESESTNQINPNFESLIIGIKEDREKHKNNIRARLKQRLKDGMIEEVEKLLESGVSHEKLKFFGLEYKFVSMYLCGELNYNDMYQKLASAIIQFSKRQMTWFRKMEKEGIKINWMKNSERELASKLISDFIR